MNLPHKPKFWPKNHSLKWVVIKSIPLFNVFYIILFVLAIWGVLQLKNRGFGVVQIDWVYPEGSKKEFLLVCPVEWCNNVNLNDRVIIRYKGENWVRTLQSTQALLPKYVRKNQKIKLDQIPNSDLQTLVELIQQDYKEPLRLIPEYFLGNQLIPAEQVNLFIDQSQMIQTKYGIYYKNQRIKEWIPLFDYYLASPHQPPFDEFIIKKSEITHKVLLRL